MVENQVRPLNEPTTRPPKGRLTWIGLGAVVLFFIALLTVIARPIIARHDGPETGQPSVTLPAVPDTGP